MSPMPRRKIQVRKSSNVDLSTLDQLLDVSVAQWERHIQRLARELRTKDVSLEIPGSLADDAANSVRTVGWTGLYDAQVKHMHRMDRAEEFRMARRYEFQKARVRDALLRAGFARDVVDDLVIRPVRALPKPTRKPAVGSQAFLERTVDELEQLRNIYVEGALYLVHGPVRRYRGLGVDEADLVQEGNASLFQAIEGFDWRRDVRFKTYAVYWIQQAILKTLYNSSRTVRVPIWVQKLHRKIRRLQEANQTAEGQLPDPLEIAQQLETTAERVEDILAVRRYAVSLDLQVAGDDGASLGQLLPDETNEPLHEQVKEGDLNVEIRAVLEDLPERERIILTRRFGLDGDEPETLGDIAEDFGVTAERIRQLQKAAIERLQKPKAMQRLKVFD